METPCFDDAAAVRTQDYPMTESAYEGRLIQLRSGLQADGTGFREYTIVELRRTRSLSESG